MTRFWDGRTDGQTDGQTDGVTALLDLLSPLATQVKIKTFFIMTEKPAIIYMILNFFLLYPLMHLTFSHF